jgi:hypothetical protein
MNIKLYRFQTLIQHSLSTAYVYVIEELLHLKAAFLLLDVSSGPICVKLNVL